MAGIISRRFAALHGMTIEGGIAGIHPSGLSAEVLGTFLIEGTHKDGRQHSPPRDFMQVAADEVKPIVDRAMKQASSAVVKGKDPRQALQRGAVAAHEAVSRAIDTFTTPANAPATIAKKGKDDPLVNKGDLLDMVFGGYDYKGGMR